jgi:hypothetical protein
MEAQGGNGDMVDSGDFQDAYVLFSLIFASIDYDLDHVLILMRKKAAGSCGLRVSTGVHSRSEATGQSRPA